MRLQAHVGTRSQRASGAKLLSVCTGGRGRVLSREWYNLWIMGQLKLVRKLVQWFQRKDGDPEPG